MADTQPFKSALLYEGLGTFQLGMDSDKNPLILQKQQLAFASNATVRGGFISDRPPVYSRAITWPSEAIQEAVEQGLFQGSVYYQPDSGPQSLIASVSGRLFQFTIVGDSVTAREITIPGDPNPATTTQAWLWQAENYIIVNDGASLPIFFDGTSSRRSYGSAVEYGVLNADFTVPEINEVALAELTDPYTGPYNVPVLFHGEYYQVIENSGAAPTYNVQLTNISGTPGVNVPQGTEVTIQPSILGYLMTAVNVSSGGCGSAGSIVRDVDLSVPYPGSVGQELLFNGTPGSIWRVVIASFGPTLPNRIRISNRTTSCPAGLSNPVGTSVQYAASSQPNLSLGTVQDVGGFATPAVGGTASITLSLPYTGPASQVVLINGAQFNINAATPAPPTGNDINLLNITDTAGGTVTAGTPGATIYSVPELPAGRMGAYGHAQNWMSLVDGLSFIASDVSRGPSGTPANNFRDAVLKTVDTTFVGGKFAISGAGYTINSMTFTANLDVSLGQGPLQIGTAASMFSVLAPFDFTDPPPMGTPIVSESLKGYGPLSQNATINANSDILFRSNIGFGSFILGRRDFNTATNWGNTPISSEMTRVVGLDDEALLGYGSAIVFDNRFLATVSPQPSAQGVIHAAAIAMNFDPVSSLRGKEPPVYDGLWTGMQVLKYDKGIFGGKERAFAWTFNVSLSKIELYELMPTGPLHFDNGTTPITWTFETAALFNGDVKPIDVMASLRDGEFAVGDVIGSVRFEVYYRPDNYQQSPDDSCWIPWHAFSICADVTGKPQHFPRLGLGEPSAKPCDPVLKTPMRDCYTCQVKFAITGSCRFLRARFSAVTIPTPKFQAPICDV